MATAAAIEVIDPATEAPLTEVADATEDDARDAVSAAYAALPGWAATPPRQRAECLRRAFGLMTERGEQIARLMSAENGKSLRDARAELTYAAEFFRWYAEEAVRIDGNLAVAPAGANKMLVIRQPIGVSVLVTPWNFPAAMATRKLGPALAAGCTVVLKPAGETPLTALAVAGLLDEAGVPAGVVNVVPTSRSGPVVAAMMADPRVRKLSFTGSTEVGRILLRQAADTVLSCSMELGGNAPFIVFDDADLDAAVGGALIAKMRNGGEACTAANRFYVHEAVADEFTSRLAGAFGKLTVGPGLEESTDVGPLVNADTRSKVSGLVEGAAGDGGRVILGGRAPDRRGYFYEPTVIDQVPRVRADRRHRDLRPGRADRPVLRRGRRSCSGPTPPNTAWSATSTPVTCGAGCGSARRWRPGWSASTAAWSPTRPPRSAASSSPAWAARAATTGCWSSWRPSTSPPNGDPPVPGGRIGQRNGPAGARRRSGSGRR